MPHLAGMSGTSIEDRLLVEIASLASRLDRIEQSHARIERALSFLDPEREAREVLAAIEVETGGQAFHAGDLAGEFSGLTREQLGKLLRRAMLHPVAGYRVERLPRRAGWAVTRVEPLA